MRSHEEKPMPSLTDDLAQAKQALRSLSDSRELYEVRSFIRRHQAATAAGTLIAGFLVGRFRTPRRAIIRLARWGVRAAVMRYLSDPGGPRER